MSSRTIVLNDALYEYLLSVSLREPDVLCRLREETAKMPQHNMQISPEQGQFMALLVEFTGARKCLEVGTFTGYSTGVHSRILKKLDELNFGTLDESIQPVQKLNDSITTDTKIIRVTKGIHWSWFNNNQKNKLFQHQYQVTDLSNRMGLRLIGNAINTKKENEITTAGIPLGAIQIPGDGQPIISFVEHQTTGGYPIIANVISADLRKIGQLKPGDCFQFELISFSTAEKLKVDQEKFIHSLHHD